jgi:hypothetical protein
VGAKVQRCQAHPGVVELYKVIKHSSQLGASYAGPVFGELTSGSFQRICSFLKAEFGFGTDSNFLDLGAGLGKPCLHVLLDPGVQYSFGVEVHELRWVLSLENLKQALERLNCLHARITPVFFANADVRDLQTLAPFSHIYMFDKGFPPDVHQAIAKAFNNSSSVRSLTCFHNENIIINEAGFHVKLRGTVKTIMCGSGEQHTAYMYEPDGSATAPQKAEPTFKEGFKLLDRLVYEPEKGSYADWLYV